MGQSVFQFQITKRKLLALVATFSLLLFTGCPLRKDDTHKSRNNVAVAEQLLFGGGVLASGQFLENGPYTFIMQSNCNLVLYVNKTKPLWSSGTRWRGKSCRATLQSNGNLVVLNGADAVVWSSNSAQYNDNYRLIMQSDGNVEIYGSSLWSTKYS